MPGVTVDDLRRSVLPSGTDVVAGAIGLDREVTWPVTLRTRPPAFPHLKGGEIALVSVEAMNVLEPGLQLVTLVRSLSGVGASAVAISGEIPTNARELADSVGLPLLSLPISGQLADLEQSIARAIVDRRTELHQRSQEIYRRLTELAIEGRGVDAILEMLAGLSEKDVVLQGQSLEIRSCVSARGDRCDPSMIAQLTSDNDRLVSWVERTVISVSDPPTLRLPIGDQRARVVAPIVVKERVLGYLSLVGAAGTFSDVDDLAASRGAAACAIELARERAVLEVEDRWQEDLVETLVTASYASRDTMRERAARVGLDVELAHVAIVFAVDDDVAKSQARIDRRPAGGRATRLALEKAVDSLRVAGHIGSHGDRAVLLVRVEDSSANDHKELAASIRESLAGQIQREVSAGVGRAYSALEGIRRSFEEAEGALTLGWRVFGAGRIVHVADLGLYRLLLALRSTTELETFYEETLGSLAEYDRRNDGELIRTLEAYFSCLGSPTDAAERLHVHRNTLLYRLNRIQLVAGIDLSDSETRLALQLSLKVRDVLNVGGAQSPTGRGAQKPPA